MCAAAGIFPGGSPRRSALRAQSACRCWKSAACILARICIPLRAFRMPLSARRICPEILHSVCSKPFAVIDDTAGEVMQQKIAQAKAERDSVGGIIECAAIGFPAGLGSPMFDGLENRLAAALFGIPAVKGLEFGEGFGVAALRGSQNNDAFAIEEGRIVTKTNHAGGILGGISTGMPLLFRLAFKPTPSIALAQQSISLSRRQAETLEITGRHDPCIFPGRFPLWKR